MNSISFSETLSNTLDMVSEWPKKRSYEPSIPTNLLFFTIDTNILPHFCYVRITFYLQTGHFYTPRTRILYIMRSRMRANGQPIARNMEIRQKGEGKHAAMADAAHCDDEATIVPSKVDGATFPKGEVWRTEGRKPNLSGQKTSS